MASTIKVDKIEGSTGSTITIPTGQTLTITDGVGVASGGTGLSSFTAGDLLYATGATTLVKLAKGTTEQTLKMNTAATAPEYGTANAIAGGTGQTTWAAGDLLYANGSNTLTKLTKPGSTMNLQMTSAGVPSWVAAASGGLLQCKQAVLTTTTSVSGNSGVWSAISGMSVSITPAATANKVLVMAEVRVGNTDGYTTAIRLKRDSTAIYVTTDPQASQAVGSVQSLPNSTAAVANYTLMFLDNPASTSAIAYSVDWFGETGHTAYVNRHTSDSDVAYRSRSVSSITAMEIDSGAL